MTNVVTKTLLYCCCSFAIAVSASAAHAEDQDYYSHPQQTAKTTPNDQQYKMPNYYNGKYYPDDEATISYHGTSNTASAQNQKQLDGNGYYYYYY